MLLEQFKWKQEVLEASEPVLVDFWAEWCGPCRSMHKTIESLARDFKVCKVNVDKNQPLAAKYNISSIPALLIFKGGQVVAQHLGITPESVLRTEMLKHSAGNHVPRYSPNFSSRDLEHPTGGSHYRPK